jgi:hypothetical protein
VIAITALASRYFSALAGKDNNLSTVLSFTPADAAFVLSFKNDESFFEIFKDYKLFDSIIGEQQAKEINQLKGILVHPAFAEPLLDKNIFISCHVVDKKIEFLYSMNLDPEYSAGDLERTLSKKLNINISSLPKNVYRLNFNSDQKPFYLSLQKGVAIGSFSRVLLENCTQEESTHLSKTFIDEVAKNSSKNLNSPINLFINHPALPAFLMHFKKNKSPENISLLSNLDGFSSLSMNFKSDALMFNGVSNTDSLSNNYLNLFLHQKPVANQIKKILPQNTSSFVAFGVSDVKKFQQDVKRYLEKRNELKRIQEQLRSLESSTGINPDRDIKPFIDKEFVLIENSYGEKFAVIKVTNGRNLNFKLQLISNAVNEKIGQLNYRDVFYYYFGEPLKIYRQPYFGVADNYLIIANTPGIITNFLSIYQNDQFLVNNDQFKEYDQLVANQSNILYFASRKNFKRTSRSTLKPQYADQFNQAGRFDNFYALSYQWTSEGDHFFTNFYLSHNSTDSLTLK